MFSPYRLFPYPLFTIRMFKLVVISVPGSCRNEEEAFRRIIQHPEIKAIHLRKPEWSLDETADFLSKLPNEVLGKIRLHAHFELGKLFPIQGYHINHRWPQAPPGSNISASCHSLEEVARKLPVCSYVFLSPIFNSISKQGYMSNFQYCEIEEGRNIGLINNKTLALGGIDVPQLPIIKEWGFEGAAILGGLWKGFEENPDLDALEKRLLKLTEACRKLM